MGLGTGNDNRGQDEVVQPIEQHDAPPSLPPIEGEVSSVLAVDVPTACAGETRTVSFENDQEVKVQSITNATIVGERYPIVFVSPQGLPTAVRDSHLIRPNLSFDAQNNLDSSWSVPDSEVVKLETPVVFLAGPGADNFYHWMHDCIPRLLVAEKAGIDAPILVPPASDKNAFIRDSLKLLGIPDDKIIEFPGGKVEAPEVWVPEDLFHVNPDQVHHSLLNEVRDRLLSALDLGTQSKGENRVFLSREGAGTTRTLVNHAEIETLLVEENGFRKVRMEDLPLEEQIRTIADASEIVAPHGAGLFHTLFMSGGKVIELFPQHPDRHSDPGKKLVEPCWFRILAAHQERGRSVQWNQCDCEVEMLSDTDFSQYRLIVSKSDLESRLAI